MLIAGIVMLIINRNDFSKLKTVFAGMKKPKAPAVQQEADGALPESADEFPEPAAPEAVKEPAMAAAGTAGEAPAKQPEHTVSESGSGEEDLL